MTCTLARKMLWDDLFCCKLCALEGNQLFEILSKDLHEVILKINQMPPQYLLNQLKHCSRSKRTYISIFLLYMMGLVHCHIALVLFWDS